MDADSFTGVSRAAKNIRALMDMSDAEFAKKYLKELSPKDRDAFLKECPEFSLRSPKDL